MKDKFSPDCLIDRIKNLKNEAGTSTVNIDKYEDIKINIRPNENVEPGMFKPDPILLGGHIAHPVTIKAMRKEIFCTGFDVDLNEKLTTCTGCQRELDLQFWYFCPYCETRIST